MIFTSKHPCSFQNVGFKREQDGGDSGIEREQKSTEVGKD